MTKKTYTKPLFYQVAIPELMQTIDIIGASQGTIDEGEVLSKKNNFKNFDLDEDEYDADIVENPYYKNYWDLGY